jgi:hypothetical protein
MTMPLEPAAVAPRALLSRASGERQFGYRRYPTDPRDFQ